MRSKRKKFCISRNTYNHRNNWSSSCDNNPYINYELSEKDNSHKIKKTYAELTNAVRLSEADNGEVSGWNITNKSEENFDEYILPYIKASKKNYKAYSFKYTFANGALTSH